MQNSETSSNWDLGVAFLCLTLGMGGIVVYQFPELWLRVNLPSTKRIVGVVLNEVGSVRYRDRALPLWLDVASRRETSVHPGGAVFTDVGSSAKITLSNGVSAKLGETTLVVLNEASGSGEVELAVDAGVVAIDFQKPNSKANVRIGGKKYDLSSEAKGSKIRIKLDKGKVNFSAQGDQAVKVNETSVTKDAELVDDVQIKPSFEVEKIADRLADPVKVAALPEPEATATPAALKDAQITLKPLQYTTRLGRGVRKDRIRVNLNWDATPGIKEYEVTVTDSSGAKLYSKKLKSTNASFELKKFPQGPLQYTVKATPEDGYRVEPKTDSIAVLSAAPRTGEVHHMERNVLLTWERTSLAPLYEYEIIQHGTPAKTVLTGKTSENFVTAPHLERGSYSYRVRAVYEGSTSEWSSYERFTISGTP